MNSEFKIDLHTHSSTSPDGGVTIQEYQQLLEADSNLYVAVTDHNEISGAMKLQDSRIIVGEEILSLQGEVIGLYLTQKIEPGLSLEQTIKEIQQQGGLVYIPHPMEKGRHSVTESDLRKHAQDIDIIEVFNARGFGRGRSVEKTKVLYNLVKEFDIASASSSDAHGIKGTGQAWTEISEAPNRENLVELLKAGRLVTEHAGMIAYLYPTWNRFKKQLTGNSHD